MDDEAAIVAQICKAIVELEVADMSFSIELDTLNGRKILKIRFAFHKHSIAR